MACFFDGERWRGDVDMSAFPEDDPATAKCAPPTVVPVDLEAVQRRHEVEIARFLENGSSPALNRFLGFESRSPSDDRNALCDVNKWLREERPLSRRE